MSDNRTRRFDVRLTPIERRSFEQAASLSGLRLSDWIRTRLRAAAEREVDRELARAAPRRQSRANMKSG